MLEMPDDKLDLIKKQVKLMADQANSRIFPSILMKDLSLPNIKAAYGILEKLRAEDFVTVIYVPHCRSCGWTSDKDYEALTEVPEGKFDCPICGKKDLIFLRDAIVLYRLKEGD